MVTVREYKDRIIGLQRQKDFNEAFEVVRNALAVYPTNTFFLGAEVYILYKLNKIKEARQRAEERIDFLKNDTFFLKTYLTILEKLRARADIEDFMEYNIFAKQSGNEDLYIFVSQLAERVFGREPAVNTIKRAIMFFPDSKKLKEMLDNLQKSEGSGRRYKHYREKFKDRKPEDAINEIDNIRLLPEFTNDFELLAYLAELYKKQADYDKAISVYHHLLTVKDNEFTRKMLGYAYYKKGDYKSALVYLRDIFLKNPDDHFLYSSIYRIFKENHDNEGLQRLINEALALHPSSRHLYGLLSRARKWRKDYVT
jgi:tetratricopeptide (TPR) repeat protein